MGIPIMPLRQRGQAFYTYPIPYSVWFDGAADYLSRTAGTVDDGKKYTVVASIKRCRLGSNEYIFGPTGGGAYLRFDTSNRLVLYDFGTTARLTTRVFRDVSAWLHVMVIVDTTLATADDRVQFWINGVRETVFTTNNTITQNDTSDINANSAALTWFGATSNYYCGYAAELHHLDGIAASMSDFFEIKNGVCVRKQYVGSYGAEGSFLDFANSGDLGNDVSGNGRDWTANSMSALNQTTDAPTDNWPTLNATFNGNTVSQGGLYAASGGYWKAVGSTMAIPMSGKWYVECSHFYPYASYNGHGFYAVDHVHTGGILGQCLHYGAVTTSGTYPDDALALALLSVSKLGWGTTDLSGSDLPNCYTTHRYYTAFALDLDNEEVWVCIEQDGGAATWYPGDPDSVAGYDISGINAAYPGGLAFGVAPNVTTGNGRFEVNFGQDIFGWGNGYSDADGVGDFRYEVPSGFKCIHAANLAEPSTDNWPYTQVVETTLYTGNALSRTISGLEHEPGIAWFKCRSSAENHRLVDALRGTTAAIYPDVSNVEATESGLTAFNSDGFDLGATAGGYNTNSATYAAWTWALGTAFSGTTTGSGTGQPYSGQYNTANGMAVITYTGNGTAGHTIPLPSVMTALYGAPKMIIHKNRTVGRNWVVWHEGLTSAAYTLFLDTTNAQTSSANQWNSTAPSSSVITLGTDANTNENGEDFVLFVFWEVPGFSKAITYEGNGAADGAFVHCGFRPGWALLKNADAAQGWHLHDNKREGYNVDNDSLDPSGNGVEDTTDALDFVSQGIKLRTANNNWNNNTMIGWAFAEQPGKYANAR